MLRLWSWAVVLLLVGCAGSIQVIRTHTIKLMKVSNGIKGGKITNSKVLLSTKIVRSRLNLTKHRYPNRICRSQQNQFSVDHSVG